MNTVGHAYSFNGKQKKQNVVMNAIAGCTIHVQFNEYQLNV